MEVPCQIGSAAEIVLRATGFGHFMQRASGIHTFGTRVAYNRQRQSPLADPMRCFPTLAFILASSFVLTACHRNTDPATPAAQTAAATAQHADFVASARELLDGYRKIIVLLADEKTLKGNELDAANRVGQAIFHENLARTARLNDALATASKNGDASRFADYETLLDYIESGKDLFDADRLAFREVLRGLEQVVAADSSLPAVKMHKRIGEDLDALTEIEREYDKELRQIFSRFETRAIELKREKWDDYVAHLKQNLSREKILKDYGLILPYPADKTPAKAENEERAITGYKLPPKTIVLTFDDGPHNVYSDEIAAILKQYNAPAVFFEVGNNIGSLDKDGKAVLSARAQVSRRLMAEGFVLGNHSFTHAQLAKESGDPLKAEISNTDTMLKSVNPQRSQLFRFPYGASNAEGMADLADLKLQSVLWNIDSLDWADPVPNSIAERVLRTVNKEGRGIILFHDIHERAVKALPIVLEQLVADGYHFAGWDGQQFTVKDDGGAPVEKVAVTTGYEDSWAMVIGIDDYAKWPKLQYAARDAEAIRKTLVDNFGFASDKVFTLKNGDATRNAILGTFHDKLAHNVKKNDRIFVFFAGHGATRHLSSGRDLGYIIPVDSDPAQIASDAIPMTEIQDIAESLTAKHVLFVMDACYSGLGLTRGGSSSQFLKENAKRIGRQMLTAGGADQLVSDGGPGGHSVFTWTLLQGLGGKADLNNDGMITGTELAAYVAPAVASISQQTPAFGSLPGSQGGEFVFELKNETEFLSDSTTQLPGDAIALNKKLEASVPVSASAPVVVKDLQGTEQKLAVPKPVAATARQLAQRANDKGLQLYREQQYAEAEAQFSEALKLRPDFALAANNLGFVFFKQQKYKEAARWFENTLKIDPSRAIAYRNLGDACVKSEDKDCARKAFKTYLELAPTGNGAEYVKQELGKLG
jgi:uncharacterized caspase-like protein/peptidoglycan/xylan/chitin deacetylase (PgdA/CDA1 family)